MTDAISGVNEIYSKLSTLDFAISNIQYDGAIHRFDRCKSGSGWYVAHLVHTDRGPFPIVICGDWVTGEKHKIHCDRQWSEKDKTTIKFYLDRAQEAEGKRREEKNAFAATLAAEIWEIAEPRRESQYMLRKGLNGNFGARVDAHGLLLVPMYCGEKLWGLQKIHPGGEKKFLSGQRTKGTYFVIGHLPEGKPAYLCEGFATGATIHMAMGLPVIVAFSASNLIEVSKHFFNYPLIVAADNDRFTDGNPGITAAQKVAADRGWTWLAPAFATACVEEKLTDFNDLYLKEGIDVVKTQLSVIYGNSPDEPPQPTQGKPKKFAEVCDGIAKIIEHDLPQRFVCSEFDDHTRNILLVDAESNTARYAVPSEIEGALLKYLRARPNLFHKFYLTPRMASECVKYWLSVSAPSPAPSPYAFLSDPALTFHRLPFDLVDNGEPTPTFDMILARTGNMAPVIRQWFGSIFVPESDRSAYMWWFGEGGDGKGSLAGVLSRVLGDAFIGTQVPDSDGAKRFWIPSFVGKRLVYFPECNKYSFTMSALFKSITGNDPVPCEYKMRMSVSVRLQCLMLFASNERPTITGTRANIRRALYAEFEPRDPKDPAMPVAEMEARLWSEAQNFITRCRQEYLEAYPTFGPIQMPDDSVQELTRVNEEQWEVMSHRYLSRDPKGVISSEKLRQFQDQARLNSLQYRSWLDWLRRNWGLKQYRTNSQRGWRGARLHTDAEYAAYILNSQQNTIDD